MTTPGSAPVAGDGAVAVAGAGSFGAATGGGSGGDGGVVAPAPATPRGGGAGGDRDESIGVGFEIRAAVGGPMNDGVGLRSRKLHVSSVQVLLLSRHHV